MTRLSLKNALVSYEQLAETPSRRDGMSQQKENLIRRYACQLIQSAGILLKSPQVVMATAQVLVNRFYYVSSIYQSDLRAIVLGAFLLASKAEEHPQRISSIITVFDALIKMHRGLTTNVLERHESEYEVMKNEMVEGELVLLRGLGFNIQVQHPYAMLLNYLRCLGLANHEKVPQIAWNYLNDGLQTNIYSCFQPHSIACSAIFLAARKCHIALPKSPPWWSIFDTNEQDILCISRTIMMVYQEKSPRYGPLNKHEVKLFMDDKLEDHINRDRAQNKAKERAQMIKQKIDSNHESNTSLRHKEKQNGSPHHYSHRERERSPVYHHRDHSDRRRRHHGDGHRRSGSRDSLGHRRYYSKRSRSPGRHH